jgi:putative ABC transport system substrate-binding protein
MEFGQRSRREVLALLASTAAAWPFAAAAQTARRVGVLMNYAATQAEGQASINAFIQALHQLGWMEGQNLRLDIRWNAGDLGLAKIYAAQLIGLMPEVILAASTANLNVIRQATSAIPIVFVGVSDPVEQGLVPNLTHPGGNITGFSNNEFSLGGKWGDLLKQAAPGLARVAVMFNPDTLPQSTFYMRSVETAAASLGVQAITVPVRTAADITSAVEDFARRPNGGLILPTGFLSSELSLIADLALRNRVPSVGARDEFARGGGLLSYGSLIDVQMRQAATYVHRILRGEKPADLPVQQADKYMLVINLKTAKALGLTIPVTLLGLADEVIE